MTQPRTDRLRPRSALAALLAVAATSFPKATAQGIDFTDVTSSVGIDWIQTDPGMVLGAGGAFLDYDGDGWLDVLLVGGDAQVGLYRSIRGQSFVRETATQFASPFGAMYLCATVADFDNDGDPDIFFGRLGPNLLYRNDGNGNFTDVTTTLVAGTGGEFTASAAFGDYDGDGVLDLYVGNYVQFPSTFPNHNPGDNFLLRGHGDGTFTDVTDAVTRTAGTTFATTWTDYDGDGDVDLFVAHDFGEFVQSNRILRNDGADPSGRWIFTDVSAQTGGDAAIYCMGTATGDYDRDGDFDYYFSNLGRNVLLRNDGGTFTDVTAASGTELTQTPGTSPPLLSTSWGIGFHDFDLDGWIDLYVSNGHVPAAAHIANGLRQRNMVFRHDGASLTFSDAGLALDDGLGRAAAFGDYDRDGDVDVLQINVRGAPNLLRNDSTRRGAAFSARLHGRLSNRDALGARLALALDDATLIREVSRNTSFESSSDPAVHFGTGTAARARSLEIRWPSGVEQQLHDFDLGHRFEIREPVATVDVTNIQILTFPMIGTLVAVTGQVDTRVTSDVLIQSQIRAAWPAPGAPSPTPGIAAGSSLWTGAARILRLNGGTQYWFAEYFILPAGVTVPPDSTDIVFQVVDAGFGLDEAKARLF